MKKKTDKFVIKGGNKLYGEITISGAKNVALPVLCATLLTNQKVILRNIPDLNDVATMINMLKSMGVKFSYGRESISILADSLRDLRGHYELAKTIRASILLLGPLLARYGSATIPLPGGCAIGSRPIDQHIKGFESMGVEFKIEDGFINAKLKSEYEKYGKLRGRTIRTDMITVTGTENLMMAGCLAESKTVIENASCEPEVEDLGVMLNKMRAIVTGHGTSRIAIMGLQKIKGCRHTIISDRIEAGTFLCLVAATGGEVLLKKVNPEHLTDVLQKLQAMGVELKINKAKKTILIKSDNPQNLKAQNITTKEYPGFPTDLQAQFMALNLVAQGISEINETIFENRFMHANEMSKLGAKIKVNGQTAIVEGGYKLKGTKIKATDLRASAGLVITGLVAEGETTIEDIYHLDRGYERMEEKLQVIGADIQRVK